jgi:branched-chain amino acid transport system ATP-binding protein
MTAPAGQPLLEVRGVSVKFGELVAVSDVSLEVQPREVIGVIGPNGAGKTTLMNTIFGLNRHATGQVLVRGRELGHMSADRRAHLGLARTFQNLELFGTMTAYENVIAHAEAVDGGGRRRRTRAAREERRTRTLELLEELDLLHLAHRTVQELGYAERKLVEFARAMVADVDLVLLDEPTAGVALEERRALVGRMQEHMLERNVAAIVVEHDMTVISRLCRNVYVLDGGAMIASGSFERVIADPRVKEAYLGQDEDEPGGG